VGDGSAVIRADHGFESGLGHSFIEQNHTVDEKQMAQGYAPFR